MTNLFYVHFEGQYRLMRTNGFGYKEVPIEERAIINREVSFCPAPTETSRMVRSPNTEPMSPNLRNGAVVNTRSLRADDRNCVEIRPTVFAKDKNGKEILGEDGFRVVLIKARTAMVNGPGKRGRDIYKDRRKQDNIRLRRRDNQNHPDTPANLRANSIKAAEILSLEWELSYLDGQVRELAMMHAPIDPKLLNRADMLLDKLEAMTGSRYF